MKKSLLPQKRRRSREIALQLLYSLDLRKDQTADGALELFPAEGEESGVFDFTTILVRGVWENRPEIDGIIRDHLTGWKPERMVAVDRAALRLALFECVISELTPVAVAISESVELAKAFGTEESGRFVNGVLGRIIRALPGKENPPVHGNDENP